jgi:hypothetical protein
MIQNRSSRIKGVHQEPSHCSFAVILIEGGGYPGGPLIAERMWVGADHSWVSETPFQLSKRGKVCAQDSGLE